MKLSEKAERNKMIADGIDASSIADKVLNAVLQLGNKFILIYARYCLTIIN